MYALDSVRYAEFITKILNDVSKGAISQPEDIREVYELANSRIVLTKKPGSHMGDSFVTIEADTAAKKRQASFKRREAASRREGDKTPGGNTTQDTSGGGGGKDLSAAEKKTLKNGKK